MTNQIQGLDPNAPRIIRIPCTLCRASGHLLIYNDYAKPPNFDRPILKEIVHCPWCEGKGYQITARDVSE